MSSHCQESVHKASEMPTSAQDPEGARRQHEQLNKHDEFLRESDWAGMLLGIGLALFSTLALVIAIHLGLRAF